jgi:hypothetical protein
MEYRFERSSGSAQYRNQGQRHTHPAILMLTPSKAQMFTLLVSCRFVIFAEHRERLGHFAPFGFDEA